LSDKEQSDRWEIYALLAELESDLLNPIYAIISNSEIIAEVDDFQGRISLALSTKKAARILEETINKLLELARIATKNFKLQPEITSVHSLTHEAALLAQSVRHGGLGLRVDVQLDSDDVMAKCDSGRMAHLISSAVLSVVALTHETRVKVTLRSYRQEEGVCCTWLIQLDESGPGATARDALRLPDPGQPRAAKRALGVLFTESLASQLGAELVTVDVPLGIQLTVILPFIRLTPPPDMHRLTQALQTGVIVVVDEPPSSFSPLPTTFTEVPDPDELDSYVRKMKARLLVLHHDESTPSHAITKILTYCQESRVPVLLRASALTYEQFNRYRYHLDAIILEPSEPSMLARYVVGLSHHNRRRDRRPANLH